MHPGEDAPLQGIVAMEFKSGETSDYDYYKFTA